MKAIRNAEVRSLAKSKGVMMYEIAEKLGISYSLLFNRLRLELSEAQRSRIVEVIDEVADEHAKIDKVEPLF